MITKMFKTLREKASGFAGIHSMLVGFGLSIAIVTALAIGFAALTDPSHLVHAVLRVKPLP
jgi:hypothetical protein